MFWYWFNATFIKLLPQWSSCKSIKKMYLQELTIYLLFTSHAILSYPILRIDVRFGFLKNLISRTLLYGRGVLSILSESSDACNWKKCERALTDCPYLQWIFLLLPLFLHPVCKGRENTSTTHVANTECHPPLHSSFVHSLIYHRNATTIKIGQAMGTHTLGPSTYLIKKGSAPARSKIGHGPKRKKPYLHISSSFARGDRIIHSHDS